MRKKWWEFSKMIFDVNLKIILFSSEILQKSVSGSSEQGGRKPETLEKSRPQVGAMRIAARAGECRTVVSQGKKFAPSFDRSADQKSR
jgi:hypothetical protein